MQHYASLIIQESIMANMATFYSAEEAYDAITTCSTWATNVHETTSNMLTRLSDRLSRFACGLSPSAAPGRRRHDDPPYWFSGLTAALLPSPGRDDDESSSPRASPSSSRVAAGEALEEEPEAAAADRATALPCVAFPSQHGYMVFSLAEDRMHDGVRLRAVTGRRVVPSPYGGGAALATDLSCFRHPSFLVNPFTGESAALPDLPVPLGEAWPAPFEAEEPRVQGRRPAPPPTDDGFAWDRCPRGAMVARGDTVFFCERGGGAGEWVPVHRSASASDTMTVNHRGGFFFVLEQRALVTTVIDAWTLRKVAVIPPPPGGDAVDYVSLVASTDDVLLLVHRARDMDCEMFSEVYRARHKKPKPKWSKVTDIGDRALFVDRLHGFSVGVAGEGTAGIRRNCVYTICATPVEDPQGRRVAVYHVEEFHVNRPEVGETLECQLGSCLVEQMWGEPYWMIPRNRG